MKKAIQFILLLFLVNIYGQEKKPEVVKSKFHLGIGIEYRLTPLKDIKASPDNFLNLETNLTGVPINFSLSYNLTKNWHTGFKYSIRHDHTGIKDDAFYAQYQIKDSKFGLISDYTLFIKKFFRLNNTCQISLLAGYSWMNNGFVISTYEHEKFKHYTYKIQALNVESNYHYKFFKIGMGIYYNPAQTHTNMTGELQLLYVTMGFNVFKF